MPFLGRYTTPYGLPHSLHVPPHLLSRRAHTHTLLPTIFTGLYFFAITLDDTRLRFMIPHSLHVPSFITHTHSLSLSLRFTCYIFSTFFFFFFFLFSLPSITTFYIYIPYYYIIFNFYFRPIRRLSQKQKLYGKNEVHTFLFIYLFFLCTYIHTYTIHILHFACISLIYGRCSSSIFLRCQFYIYI